MATKLASRSRPKKEPGPALTPEESTLVIRLSVFVAMRWIAIASVLIVSLLATQVFNISFPLLPIYIIAICTVAYNLVFFFQARDLKAEASGIRPKGITTKLQLPLRRLLLIPKTTSPLVARARAIGNLHIALDLVVLTILLHFTGGLENPFIFLFVFHVIIAGILLHYRVAYVLATLAILLVLLVVGLESNGVIPHVHLEGFTSASLYKQETYILGILVALAVTLYGSAYMVSHMSGELRKQQREVVALKDSGLREKTKELKEATKELAALEEGRRQLLRFLGIVAHDLKAPLSAVQSYLQLMVGGFAGEMADKQKHMLDRSSQRITGLLNLISDLLDISRIEAGQIVREFEEISLSQTVKDSLENVRNLAREKKIGLKVEMPKSLPQIKASGTHLQQVMTNLLANAIKFTPEKGTIKLRVTDHENNIQVEVMDNGDGIATEELPKIFDDFHRGSDPTKAGTGLGLSIAKRIVEAHKGRIWAESPNPEDKLARGSKFTFILPKNLESARNRREKEPMGKGER